jgi:hypothetical protein
MPTSAAGARSRAFVQTPEVNSEPMSDVECAFAERAIRRKRVFWVLSMVSVGVAALLAVIVVAARLRNPSFAIGPRLVIVLLILLNARQNLRQYKYAAILEKLLPR